MKILFIILLLPSINLVAKEVYFADVTGVKTSETVSPTVKLWYIKDYFFRKEHIDLKQYALGIKTREGFMRPDTRKTLGDFGETWDGPVLFHIVPIEAETGRVQELTTVRFRSDDQNYIQPAACNCPKQGTADPSSITIPLDPNPSTPGLSAPPADDSVIVPMETIPTK